MIATHIVETHVSPDEEKRKKEKEKKSDDSMSHTLTVINICFTLQVGRALQTASYEIFRFLKTPY